MKFQHCQILQLSQPETQRSAGAGSHIYNPSDQLQPLLQACPAQPPPPCPAPSSPLPLGPRQARPQSWRGSHSRDQQRLSSGEDWLGSCLLTVLLLQDAHAKKQKEIRDLMKKRREKAVLVDRISRWLFPTSFILLNIVYWALFGDHDLW